MSNTPELTAFLMYHELARVALVGNHTSYLDGYRSLNPQASQYTWAVNTGLAYPNNAGTSPILIVKPATSPSILTVLGSGD